jgi:hypothetical protein
MLRERRDRIFKFEEVARRKAARENVSGSKHCSSSWLNAIQCIGIFSKSSIKF